MRHIIFTKAYADFSPMSNDKSNNTFDSPERNVIVKDLITNEADSHIQAYQGNFYFKAVGII